MNKKILLIGNGSSIEDKKIGEYIDNNFDVVVRFNRAKTEGFEEYVGSKTSIWAIHDLRITLVDNNILNKYDKITFVCPNFKYNNFKKIFDNKFKYIDKNKVILISSDYENKIKNNQEGWNNAFPTTGFLNILWALDYYKDDQIYIYGFDHVSKDYKYYHYFDKGDKDRTTEFHWNNKKEHRPDLEEQYLKSFIESRKIIDLNKEDIQL